MRLHEINRGFRVLAMPDRPPLEPELEAQVQTLWEAERELRKGALFNGELFSIDEQTPDRITGEFVEYRLFVAQHRRPELFERLRIRPLAMSGMIESPDGMIFGRRSLDLMTDGGKWELVPSGGLDPETCLHGCNVDYMEQFYKELTEEVGMERTQISDATPFALIEDTASHVLDLGIAAQTYLRTDQINLAFSQLRREYSELRIVGTSELARFRDEQGPNIVAVTSELLRCSEGHYPS